MSKDPSVDLAAFASGSGETWFGHPRGLATLFFTEMWERFSYYGMRALLVLFMVGAIADGGMGLNDARATAIYGIYTACVYLFALPGGWVADRLLGLRKAIWYGGIIIACGHFSMAIPTTETFFLGLVLIVVGTGLLKPNVSAIVGDLYPEGGARRDAGFSIFYMGINVGAFVAPLICGYLGESIDWHLGFAAAGVGMVLGLIQFKLTERHLGDIGVEPSMDPDPEIQAVKMKKMRTWFWAGVLVLAVVVGLGLARVVEFDPVALAGAGGVVIFSMAVLYFASIMFFGGLTPIDKRRVGAMMVFFLFSAIFWSGFEQAGSSLNLFAERYTDRFIGAWEMPASWLQSVNSLFIITLAPFFGWLWVSLAKRNLEPTSPLKFAFGLIFLGLGFLVMAVAARLVAEGSEVLPTWLIVTYLLHTIGELALSPVGLSTVTKLAPHKMVGQMMGVWFMSIAFGNLIAGLVAGRFDPESVAEMPGLFLMVTIVSIVAGLVLILLYRLMKWLMAGVR